MKLQNNLILGVVFSICIACGGTSKTETKEKEEVKTDVSELTYLQIYQLVLEQANGSGMDFHGEGYGMEASEKVTISQGDSCGESNCGNLMVVTNSGDTPIKFAVKANFTLPGNPLTEMIREYRVEANETAIVGCSHLCYEGNSYKFDREIISAAFISE